MSTLFTITFSLLVAFILSELFRYFRLPKIIGQLSTGLILAIPFIKTNLFNAESALIIETFAGLGVIFLLLLTGLEADTEKMRKNSRDAILIAFFAALTPFLFGTILGRFFDYSWITSLILGGCLALTAEATNVSVLMEMKKIKTRVSNIILEAGILDDIFGMLFLTFVIIFINNGNLKQEILILPFKAFILALITIFAYHFIPKLVKKIEKENSEIVLFNLTIIIGLIFAILSEVAGLGVILGAFLAGIILQKSFSIHKDELHEEKNLKLITFGLIIPFFFISISLNFNYADIILNPLLTFSILIVAILGKIIGTFLTKPFTKMSWGKLHLIGWSMNSRGLIELIIAQIALKNNLIDHNLFSAIVIMAITTTIIFPFVIKYLIQKNPKIMN